LGATDAIGAEVTDMPVEPHDLMLTIRTILGTVEEPPPVASGRLIGEIFA
jgi:hypothetical protein